MNGSAGGEIDFDEVIRPLRPCSRVRRATAHNTEGFSCLGVQAQVERATGYRPRYGPQWHRNARFHREALETSARRGGEDSGPRICDIAMPVVRDLGDCSAQHGNVGTDPERCRERERLDRPRRAMPEDDERITGRSIADEACAGFADA
ncbi:hypothetical protein [Rhodococcus rhodochrous]|uniref:hypothetical protein n=1 Tax=Rhodococcus rhodochrous TaxID=1829 RepID=UPI0013521107|nr:hypothetical protein [Rhodococcus rhodochrous]